MLQGTAWYVACAATGALLLWCKEGPEKLRVYALSPIVDRLPVGENARYCVKLAVFLALGSFMGLVLTEPTNARQALTAGFAWTAALARR